MTYKVHGYLDGNRVINWRMEHLPSTGDTVRFAGEKYGKVTEVIWCMDEPSKEGQRVNIRIASEPANVELTGLSAAKVRVDGSVMHTEEIWERNCTE